MFIRNKIKEMEIVSDNVPNESVVSDIEQSSDKILDLDVVEKSNPFSIADVSQNNKGSFVIKNKPINKEADIVQNIDFEQLYTIYPTLKEIVD